MWLLEGSRQDGTPGAQKRSQRLEFIGAQEPTVAPREVPGELVPSFRGRQPGGVVEASGVLRDWGRQHRSERTVRRPGQALRPDPYDDAGSPRSAPACVWVDMALSRKRSDGVARTPPAGTPGAWGTGG